MTWNSRTSGWALGGLFVVAMAGCAGHATYDPAEGTPISMRNFSHSSMVGVMSTGAAYTARFLPPELSVEEAQLGRVSVREEAEPFVLSLPEGLTRGQYLQIVREAGPRAHPPTDETLDLPIYRIGRIEIRVGRAEVDVHRPVEGEVAYQPVTLSLEGGVQPWRVTGFRAWEPGSIALPPVHPLPADGPGRGADGRETPEEEPLDDLDG